MRFFVRLGDDEHEVLINGEHLTVDGEAVRGRIEDLPGTPIHIVYVNNRVHRVLVQTGPQPGAFELAIDGYRWRAEALTERTRTIRELSAASPKVSLPTHLVAPMPGLVVRINVSEGDQVSQGQGLVVMEAMKMENELRASAAGSVRRVLVSPGSAVEKGAVLLEMETG